MITTLLFLGVFAFAAYQLYRIADIMESADDIDLGD